MMVARPELTYSFAMVHVRMRWPWPRQKAQDSGRGPRWKKEAAAAAFALAEGATEVGTGAAAGALHNCDGCGGGGAAWYEYAEVAGPDLYSGLGMPDMALGKRDTH